MIAKEESILLIGESGVGKTHYGAQLLKRLMKDDCQLRMSGAATNLEPFQAALECLNEGLTAGHTATATYVDSIWPIIDRSGRGGDLVWPDYGGEQIKKIIESRRVPQAWKERVQGSRAWLVLIRLHNTRVSDDIFSRPLAKLQGASIENREVHISDQARLIELLQMLLYVRGEDNREQLTKPSIAVLLTCWDELTSSTTPPKLLREQLPMLYDFIVSNWAEPHIFGLSALERPLSAHDRDEEYAARGPENFGYIIREDGARTHDLTEPVACLVGDT